nr:nucleoprotein [Diaporthe negative-stranded RNA virus 1]
MSRQVTASRVARPAPSGMSRPIPSSFIQQETYGVETSKERDRLPKIDDTTKVGLKNILIGKRDFPIRLCLAGLGKAETTDDVARLVIGALLSASGTKYTTAKVTSVHDKYVETLKDWANKRAYGVKLSATTGAVEGDAGETDVSTDNSPFPTEVMPEWYNDLETEEDEHVFAWTVSSTELAAYAGVLAHAIGKQPTPDNLTAYNEKRRNAISQYMTTGEPSIFVDESPYLSLDILGKVHRAFNSIITDRVLIMSAIVDNDHDLVSGDPRMFYVIFRLGQGASLNPLLIITRYARKYPAFYSEFPDLETEYHACAHALQRFLDVSENRRMYLKVIFGSAYVPVKRGDIDSLLGIAVFVLQQTEKSLGNYRGGLLSVAHREKIVHLLNLPKTQEEEVPEEPTA